MNRRTLSLLSLLCATAACASDHGGKATETTPNEATASAGAAATGDRSADNIKHAIVIARPFSVGQRVRVEVEAAELIEAVNSEGEHDQIDIEGLTDERRLSLRGVVDVQEVDAQGRVSRAAFQVEHFFDLLANEQVLPAGSKLLVYREGGESMFQVDGEKPDSDLEPLLRLAFPLVRPGGTAVSDVLGTTTPKAVGESWEISKAKVVNDMNEDGYKTQETNVAGKATLLGTTSCGTGTCLELAGKIQADRVAVSGLSGVDATESGAVEGMARVLLPTDDRRPVFLEDGASRMVFEIDLSDEEGEEGEAAVQVVRRRVATYALIP